MRVTHHTSLLPYTTLFRSERGAGEPGDTHDGGGGDEPGTTHCEPSSLGGVRPYAGAARRVRERKRARTTWSGPRSEEHTSELQSLAYLVCRLLLEKKKHKN